MNEKKYDAWLQWTVTDRCNLDCKFCFYNKTERMSLIKRNAPARAIDVKPLMETLDRSEKTFLIGFTGGEPFLVPNFVDACREITRRHYISIVTNLTSPNVARFFGEVDPDRVVSLDVSFHLEELERSGLIDRHVSNIRLCRERGFPVCVTEVAYPPYLERVEEYRRKTDSCGIDLYFVVYRGMYESRLYPDAYTVDDLRRFDIDSFQESEKSGYYHYNRMCIAGSRLAVVSPSGILNPCYQIRTCLGDIYRGFELARDPVFCPYWACKCPLYSLDPYLVKKALTEADEKKKVKYFMPGRDGIRGSKPIDKKYCIVVAGVDDREIRSIRSFIGSYAVEVVHVRHMLPCLEDGYHSVIHVEYSKETDALLARIRSKLGNPSRTKILVRIDGGRNDIQSFQGPGGISCDSLSLADLIAVSDPLFGERLERRIGKPVFTEYDSSFLYSVDGNEGGNRKRKSAERFVSFLETEDGKP